MRYWSFQSNPRKYRIEAAVRQLVADSWATTGHDIQKGDRALIWKAAGGTGNRGVLAFAEVIRDPAPSKDIYGIDYAIPPLTAEEIQEEFRVTVAYLNVPTLPLWVNGPHHDEVSALRIFGGVNFGLLVTVIEESKEKFERVVAAAGGWPDRNDLSHITPEQEDRRAIEGIVNAPRDRQGFLVNTEARRAIEMYAMTEANKYYTSQGWQVQDVSAYQPYDLRCTDANGRELYVEVKGTSTDGAGVLLTRNEVAHAHAYYPRVSLFIVANVQLQPATDGTFVASGGHIIVREPWNLNDDDLTALAYSYRVP
ncbi:MAG TPA: DUF3883 domain-containing protein [Ktedonobacterales bacterium]